MTQPEAPCLRTLQRSAALGLLLLFAAPAAYSYSVLTHEAIIDSDLGQCDQTTATQAIPGRHTGRVEASTRVRLRRMHYSGSGVLSVRQQVLQRFDPLCPERRFHPQPDPRIARPQ